MCGVAGMTGALRVVGGAEVFAAPEPRLIAERRCWQEHLCRLEILG